MLVKPRAGLLEAPLTLQYRTSTLPLAMKSICAAAKSVDVYFTWRGLCRLTVDYSTEGRVGMLESHVLCWILFVWPAP